MIKVEIDEGSGFCFGVVTATHCIERTPTFLLLKVRSTG